MERGLQMDWKWKYIIGFCHSQLYHDIVSCCLSNLDVFFGADWSVFALNWLIFFYLFAFFFILSFTKVFATFDYDNDNTHRHNKCTDGEVILLKVRWQKSQLLRFLSSSKNRYKLPLIISMSVAVWKPSQSCLIAPAVVFVMWQSHITQLLHTKMNTSQTLQILLVMLRCMLDFWHWEKRVRASCWQHEMPLRNKTRVWKMNWIIYKCLETVI